MTLSGRGWPMCLFDRPIALRRLSIQAPWAGSTDLLHRFSLDVATMQVWHRGWRAWQSFESQRPNVNREFIES